MELREYQNTAIDDLHSWFGKNESGHPCLVMPTGSGKSLIIAKIVMDALQQWPETRILMLCHVKELIIQNAEKLNALWPDAPLGVYSAGIGRRELDRSITYAGIQSIRNHADKLGFIDLILVDECHLISAEESGTYREFIGKLIAINPALRIIGLSATPYRLGHGYMHEGEDCLFTGIVEPVSVEQLIYQGYLSKLRSKFTDKKLDASGVAKRGGEYVPGQLEKAVNTAENNEGLAAEVLRRAAHCKSILVFATGIAHAEKLAIAMGGEFVTGKTLKKDRDEKLTRFKGGSLRVLTNANVLTTGFDAPNIDCIVLARPTMSPGLYVQMVGRGMRLKSHTNECLILDFAGLVSMHGPITDITPPSKNKKGGEAPIKVCPDCQEIVHLSVMMCPSCKYEFPRKEAEERVKKLHDDDIMGISPTDMDVTEWFWDSHVSRASGKKMLRVKYYGSYAAPVVAEYLCVAHEGYAGLKALDVLNKIASSSGAQFLEKIEMADAAQILNASKAPTSISYKRDGKYFRVLERNW